MSLLQTNADEAVISEVAAHHIETFYGKGTPSLASLSDLVEICQAAVFHERLVVSPVAYKYSTLLQQLKCADTFEISVSDIPDTPFEPPVKGDKPKKREWPRNRL